jgi:transcriptional regulator with XRE-family HTH domain
MGQQVRMRVESPALVDALLGARALTRKDIATRLNRARSIISPILGGKETCSVERADEIARALGEPRVSVDLLFARVPSASNAELPAAADGPRGIDTPETVR